MAFQNSGTGHDEDEGSGSDYTEINITPFVDVVLVLLVIFMVTAPAMLNEQLKVKLPKTLTSDIKDEQAPIALAITKEGQILFNGDLVSDEVLQQRLDEVASLNKNTSALLSADADSRHGDLVRIIDLLKLKGLNNFALQVEKIDRPATGNTLPQAEQAP
jgi:biopolymer transport protein TolR